MAQADELSAHIAVHSPSRQSAEQDLRLHSGPAAAGAATVPAVLPQPQARILSLQRVP